jgi:hypothetical protein
MPNQVIAKIALLALLALAGIALGKNLPLDSAAGVKLHNTTAAPASFKGKKALKLTSALPTSPRPAATKKAGKKKGNGPGGVPADHLAIIDGVEFSSGTIEVDLAGEPGPAAEGDSRGFVGIAFRVQPDRKTYDCFYLRPTNGRVDDQERRNHTAQYMSHPDYPWFKLREQAPSRYESYVDIGPAEWTHVKIEVDGDKARLFVNGNQQPTLIVNDVKSGAAAKGAVALWIERTTVAHFANLKITPR